MLKVKFKDKKYSIPDKLHELNWQMGKAFDNIYEEFDDENITNIETKKWLLATLMKCDYDLVNQISSTDISTIIDNHIFFDLKDKTIFLYKNKNIRIKNKLYKLKTFDNITVEEFSDIEFFLQNNDYDNVIKLLIQPIKSNFLKRIKYVNYQSINHLNYYFCKYLINNFLIFKQKLLSDYQLLVTPLPDDQVDAETHTSTTNDLEQYGLYHIILNYSNDEYFTLKSWMNEDVRSFFKYLSYMNKKQIILNQQNI
jgi:hypothetical protein